MSAARAALFLDRDGTLIVDRHYLRDPAQVELVPDGAAAIRTARALGLAVVVVTNQSGIARGALSEADFRAVTDRLDARLAEAGAAVDATFHCAHHPDFTGPCDCRKPGTGLYRQAAAALDLDLARSWYVGDRWRDVAPALALGGRGILVPSPDTPAEDRAAAQAQAHVADTLGAALALIDAALSPAPR
jgi:D-glycero-D-manno-heptose 1,7-bisphosphate phosphatase